MEMTSNARRNQYFSPLMLFIHTVMTVLLPLSCSNVYLIARVAVKTQTVNTSLEKLHPGWNLQIIIDVVL